MESRPSPTQVLLRSVAAILSGFVFIAMLATVPGIMLRQLAPDTGGTRALVVFVFVTGLAAAITTGAGFLTARLAPTAPLLHVMILGIVVLLLNIGVAVLSWDSAPLWYHAATFILVLPCVWVGMRMHENRRVMKEAERSVLIVWRP